MMVKGKLCDVTFHRSVFILVVYFVVCVVESRPQGNNVTLSAEACYGNVNNYLRLECEGQTVIKVLEVYQGAKLKASKCITPASVETYKKMCCQPEKTDCRFKVDNLIGNLCDGNSHCHHMAMWSRAGNMCDQDIYPLTITYNQAFYTCVPLPLPTQTITTTATSTATIKETPPKSTLPPAKDEKDPGVSKTTTTTTTTTTEDRGGNGDIMKSQKASVIATTTSSVNASLTSVILTVVSHDGSDDGVPKTTESDTESIAMNDAIVVAVLCGILGMFFTLVIFIFYWRRKRRLRIQGKHQSTVWDYLLSQTFTVRGERGYDHFSSCRSSASSDGDAKSSVIRKNFWLPNISPMEDTQSDVFNDSESTNHKLEFHQLGSSNPYAFLTLGVNSSPGTGRHLDA